MDFSMRVFVFLVLGVVADGAVSFFHLNFRFFKTRIVFSMRFFFFGSQAY